MWCHYDVMLLDDDESGTEDTQHISQHRSQLNCSYVRYVYTLYII